LGFSGAVSAGCSGDETAAGPSQSTGGAGGPTNTGGSNSGTGGKRTGGAPSTTPDAAADASLPGSFVIADGGETRTITFPDGTFLKFAFPASAAGKRISLQIVDDATLGLDGKFPHLVEMLPHGLTFDPPVLVTPDWSKEVPVLRTFANATAANNADVLAIAADKAAFELPHFSYISVEGITFNCPFPGTNVPGVVSTLCKATQHEQYIYCDDFQACRAISAHCCVDIVANLNYGCTELLDYKHIPINYSPCGNAPRDAGHHDAAPDPIGRPDSGQGGSDSGRGGSGGTSTGGTSQGGGGQGGGSQGGSSGATGSSSCPEIGVYSMTVSGNCGDLDTNVPRQRIDGFGTCSRYWEFDSGGGPGIGTGVLDYTSFGADPVIAMNVGSGTLSCKNKIGSGNITLECANGTGLPVVCTISLTRTGPL
jgi:hypothetical protein